MSTTYNAFEIFEIGVQIEKNGKAFYEQAAGRTDVPNQKKLFSELSEWEAGHVDLFERLKDELPSAAGGADLYDPDGDMQRYLKAAADSHVFLRSLKVGELVDGCKDAREVLLLALQFEKDSVVLYSTMKEVVPPSLGRDRIETLIKEELSHIAFIQNRLASL